MKNINLKFGGFYGSWHESMVDRMLENFYEDREYSDLDINYTEIFKKYSEQYIDIFSEWLRDTIDTDFGIKFVSLQSPKYYNFETDTIEISIKKEVTLKNINSYEKEFLEWLKNETTSCDGFISFFSLEEVLKNKDNIFSVFALNFLAKTFNDNDFFDYYDRNYCYELIYNLEVEKND